MASTHSNNTSNGFSRDSEKNGSHIPGISDEKIRAGDIAPADLLAHSHDADEALKAFASYQGQVIQLDEATNRRLLRKIDWHIMPVSSFHA